MLLLLVWRRFCAGFRHSAGFHARVVLLDSDAFRPGLLGEVDDALGVLGADRVVAIVVSVLVWSKGETCADQMTDSFQAHEDDSEILEPSACDAFRACEQAVLRCMCSLCGVLSTS